jgi:hypothetical protein
MKNCAEKPTERNDGIGAGMFDVVSVLLAADLTHGSGRELPGVPAEQARR